MCYVGPASGSSNSRSKLIFRPLSQDDPRRRRPDISKATSQLNWQPTVMLDQGLRMTIVYFDKLLTEGRREVA